MSDGTLYAGIAGAELEVDEFKLGHGVVISKTFAHLMAPFMLAFSPAEPGKPHPAPWAAAHGGLGFDLVTQLEVPADVLDSLDLSQRSAAWWIVEQSCSR